MGRRFSKSLGRKTHGDPLAGISTLNEDEALALLDSLEEDAFVLILDQVQDPRNFELGDCIRYTHNGRLKFGRIIGFLHPDGLYSESYEKGYNGKDFLECVEISGRAGLPRKVNSDGHPKTFRVHSEKAKICDILPMDKNGGIRIKDYWELRTAK
mgnify:CR=1 FL=1